jgi:integrase
MSEDGRKIRAVHRLSSAFVMKTKRPGLHADGGNLLLQVSIGPAGNVRKSWIFRFQRHGCTTRDMGLGSASTLSLHEAREIAREHRKLLLEGLDPIEVRNAKVAANLAASAAALTFDEAAAQYMQAHRSGWSIVHSRQWESSLKADASPIIGKLDVRAIDTGLVMKVLGSIWAQKTVSANRLRGRIEAVLDWAKARGYRDGENPARWQHLKHLLAAPDREQKHFAALPYPAIPEFMRELRQREGVAALMLEFVILTATRVGEIIGARWDEVDLSAKVLTIPPERMKAGKEHRIPLSGPALAALEKVRDEYGSQHLLFANELTGRPIGHKAILRLVASIGAKCTTHGFRSSFRDWAGDRTSFPREVTEAALAHRTGDAVEAAYRRSDALEKRRKLMDAWSAYCSSEPATAGARIISFR